MTRKSDYKIRIAIGQDEIDKLQSGRQVQLGLIDLGLPIRIFLQKRKTPKIAQ
jgi:hypothetical protein